MSTLAVAAIAILGALRVAQPLRFAPAPFAAVLGAPRSLGAKASRNAFGTSQGVSLFESMPSDTMQFPLEVAGDPSALAYRWVPVSNDDARDTTSIQPLAGSTVVTPTDPGVYRLALSQHGIEEVITEPVVAVLVPFREKHGGFVDGYRIGTYIAEKMGRKHNNDSERPIGFIKVREDMVNLPVSKHFRLKDFVTHDAQEDVWPKYLALDPRLLDKLELVLQKLAQYRGEDSLPTMSLDVHSGFRTPDFNAGVDRSAKDSRHQHGDAADVVIDADRDGRITMKDEMTVARAVEDVEREHPDLVGGMGLYTSKRFRVPYVHIDARGTRSRWRG
ncbi:MAG TPA: hypothetical protein VIV65_09500 [Gemmatimonadaceae bacterium]